MKKENGTKAEKITFIALSGLLIMVSLTNYGFAVKSPSWRIMNTGIKEPEVKHIQINSSDTNQIYAATKSHLYKKSTEEHSFKSIFNKSSTESEISAIYISDSILLATGSKLYESLDNGNSFKIIFISQENEKCLSVLKANNSIFLGTTEGLYYKREGQTTWNSFNGRIKSKPIYQLSSNQEYNFASSFNSVFRFTSDADVKEILSLGLDQTPEETITEEEGPKANIIDITTTGDNSPVLYIATNKGVYFSEDNGEHLKPLETSGLPYSEINSLSVIKSHGCNNTSAEFCADVFAGTNRGAFILKNKTWQQLYKGMSTNAINEVATDNEENIYAATNHGLFSLRVNEITTNSNNSEALPIKKIKSAPLKSFIAEPTISQVQKMAIEYAEVHPNKIKEWREGARKKAWLPNVSLGLAQDKNRTIGDSVYGSYTSGGQQYVGPDDKTFYDNLGWDVSLSWDLGDIVWNSDQTSIDSRAKMMVELREDILDQVTRLYFERRRLQIELQRAVDIDEITQLDSQLRIEELTALIDALTGGEFSKETENKEFTPTAAVKFDKKEDSND